MRSIRVDRFEAGSPGCLVAERCDRGFRLRMMVGLAASCAILAVSAQGVLEGLREEGFTAGSVWPAALVLLGFVLPHLLWLRFAWGRDRVELDGEKLRIREIRPFEKTRVRTVPRARIGGLRLRPLRRMRISMKPYPPWFWRFLPVRAWVVEVVEGPARKACVELLATRDEAVARARAQELARALALPLEEESVEGTFGLGEIAWASWRSGADGLFHVALLLAVLLLVGKVVPSSSMEPPACDGEFRATSLAVDPDGRHVYWLDPVGGVIRRSGLAGEEEVELVRFAQPSFGNLAIDRAARRIYWSERRSGTLRRANLDGTQVEDLLSDRDVARLALDPQRGHVYWVQREDGDIPASAWLSYWRADLDGSHAEPLSWRIRGEGVRDVAIASGHFYWIARQGGWPAVFRVPLVRPGEPEVVFTQEDIDNTWNPLALAVDPSGDSLFWIEDWTSTIQRASVGGSDYEKVATVSSLDRAYLAFDPVGRTVYWSDGCRIQRAPVDSLVSRTD